MGPSSHAGLGGRSRLRFLTALAIAALASPGVLAWAAPPVSAAVAYCDTFSATTPGAYFCVVPADVTSLDYVVAAGDGGRAWASEFTTGFGGHGAQITGSLTVTPGETLDIVVGGNGANGHGTGAGGGGYSSIARGTTPLIVAGGGGGGGFGGATGGSGYGGLWYDGGGAGGDAGLPGMDATDGSSGGLRQNGGDGGYAVVAWSDDLEPLPIYGAAGDGGYYDTVGRSPNGVTAANDTHGGGGGGAFGGSAGLHDQTHDNLGQYALGASSGAGGNGGFDGGGGGGGYAGGGGGGGGGGAGPDAFNVPGGGGGGGSSLVPSGGTRQLSLTGPTVSLTGPAPSTTLYVVPEDAITTYGLELTGAYLFTISSTADGLTPVEPSSLTNYTPPTCGSSYTTSTSVADSPLVISCGGGSNAGSAGSADGVVFDYTLTAELTIQKAWLYVLPRNQILNAGSPVPDGTFYGYGLYTDLGHTIPYTGTVDVPPTCGSGYTPTTTDAVQITCGGGSNAGTAGVDANHWFDYSHTNILNVNNGPTLDVTLRVKGAVLAPVIWTADPDNVDSVVCTLDGGAEFDCSGPWKSGTLSKGIHSFSVTATDTLGASTWFSSSVTIKSGKVR